MTGALMTPAAEVEAARTALREAIDDLTTIGHHKLETDEGDVRHATTPPLLDQVDNEIAGNSQNAGGNSWRSKLPLWEDAMALFIDVDRHVSRYDGASRAERVRRWGAECSSGSPATVVDAAEQAARWVESCRQLLNPKPRHRLTGQACPQCSAERVWDREDHDNGERYARPALEIDPKIGACVCRACDAQWHPELWSHLAMVLEQQRAETLAARGWSEGLRAKSDAERGRNTYR